MWLAGVVNYFLNAQQLSKVRRANMKRKSQHVVRVSLSDFPRKRQPGVRYIIEMEWIGVITAR